MRKTFSFVLILMYLSLPAFARTPEACRAQLARLTVPEYSTAFSFVSHNGRAKLPSRLLFSQDGIEVCADTFPNGRDTFMRQISGDGMRVLVVYQDEAVRQAMIKELRDKNVLPPRGLGALVDDLKYAEILFTPEWLPSDLALGNNLGNPFDRKWSVSHIEYDQPQQCMNVFQNDVHPTLYDSYDHSVSIISETNPIHIEKLPANKFPLWSKALDAALVWAKECSSLVDR